MNTQHRQALEIDYLSIYPTISDYALIGDCRTVALVSLQGSIDWLCLPFFSGPSVFAALLDRHRGGQFTVRPTMTFTTERRYREGTNVLETTFKTADGTVRVTDVMPIVPEAECRRLLQPLREVLRIVEGIDGEAELEVIFEPRPDYARACPRLSKRGALGWACQHRNELFVLKSDWPLTPFAHGTAVRGRLRIAPGEKRYLSLTYTKEDIGVIAPLGQAAEERLAHTVQWWQTWSDRCTYQGLYREAVLRSALTLKLLTFAISGAVIAAATTSLPETIGGGRNWDYRYCWLRDASLALCAFADLGFNAEGETFLEWLLHATRLTWPRLQVLYDVYGETHLPEEELKHLEGYRGSRPVRIGNAAYGQLQLDIYGAVTLAAFNFVERGGRLERHDAHLLTGFGRTVCKHWQEPDEGIWEIRDQRRHHTYSKVMCWATLNCLIKLHERGHLRIPEDRFRRERAAIYKAIETQGFNASLNSYVSFFGGQEADASLLLLARYGYKAATDPRMLGTYDYIRRELGHDGLFYRYRTGTDALPGDENAFGICGFWAVDYLARCGRADEAMTAFAHLLSYANDVGLFAEEINVDTGAALGNYPQAFTHIGLITAALTLAEHTGRGQEIDREPIR